MGTTIFESKAVTKEQMKRINDVRTNFGYLLDSIDILIPGSREKSLMITKLEEACMWGTKAISREEPKEEE